MPSWNQAFGVALTRARWSITLGGTLIYCGCSESAERSETSGAVNTSGASSETSSLGSVSSASGGATTGPMSGLASSDGTIATGTTEASAGGTNSSGQGSVGGNAGAAGQMTSGANSSGAAGSGGQPDSCGNGAIEAGESCDDSNVDAGDGCSARCQVVCSDYHEAAVLGPQGSCYHWEGPNTLPFPEAVTVCQSLGGHLVSVSSETEQAFLETISEYTWLGAYDGFGSTEPTQGAFTWTTEEAFEYTNWGEGQPNNTLHACPESVGEGGCYEHCVVKEDTHTWNDTDCMWENSYTCEWDPPGT